MTNNITGVPASALATVGKGSVLQFNPAPIIKVTGPALTSNGKPEMLYIGAEYCPYCAAMRWSMAVALSRFGTLSTPLHGIHFAQSDLSGVALVEESLHHGVRAAEEILGERGGASMI